MSTADRSAAAATGRSTSRRCSAAVCAARGAPTAPRSGSAASASSCRTLAARVAGCRPPSGTDGALARCSHCASGQTAPCRECGELTAGRDKAGRPRCERCYARPVGTCGRCGRVRAIVRLAVDGDPDLCAICWTGPTVKCENCGKVRPCRGERRGRMLCGTCAPVRPQICAHCGQSRRPTAQWPEGPVCQRCYTRALDAKAECPGCGQRRRLLRYAGHEQPLCSDCAGVAAQHVCGRCGTDRAVSPRAVPAVCEQRPAG